MIDHLNIPVKDLTDSRVFYGPVLGSLGLRILYEDDEVIGFGTKHWEFGIVQEDKQFAPLHVALKAKDKASVKEFHTAAVKAGATDNGAPGLRSEYGQGYYAAYVIDPDGHNIEAVFRST